MSNELIPTNDLPVSKYGEETFNQIVKAGDWLPRVQLMTSNSNLVKEDKIKQGYYALIRDKDHFVDLTNSVNCLCVAWHPRAMRVGGDTVQSVYNPEHEEFKKIQADSEVQDSGCMFGPEFLIWLAGIKEFAGFFMSSKTARREAPNLRALVGRAATLKSQLIKGQKFTWHGPVIVPCTTPFADLPSMDQCKEQTAKFHNTPETDVETVEDETRAR